MRKLTGTNVASEDFLCLVIYLKTLDLIKQGFKIIIESLYFDNIFITYNVSYL